MPRLPPTITASEHHLPSQQLTAGTISIQHFHDITLTLCTNPTWQYSATSFHNFITIFYILIQHTVRLLELPDSRQRWQTAGRSIGLTFPGRETKTVLPLSLLHTYAVLTFLHRLITSFGYAQYCHYNAQGMCCQPNKQWTTPVIALEVSRPENGADHSPSSGHG